MAMICSYEMQFLPKMRQRDEKYLSELWWRTGEATDKKLARFH